MQSNPFVLAFSSSDFLGKLIFIALIATSICCWITLVHKALMTKMAKKHSASFESLFISQSSRPLDLPNESAYKNQIPNPFYQIYQVLKKQTIDLLNKNHRFGLTEGEGSYLTSTDIDFLESHLMVSIANETKGLEKNLYLLSTIVGLAPLLGLLGTVWGILITFSDLQNQSGGNSQEMLGGLSLALTTTVLGLVSAIPALIAYNYLKNTIRNLETEMEGFSTLILSSVELQYRKVDHS